MLTKELLDPAAALTAQGRAKVLEAATGLPRTLADMAALGIGGPSLRITDHQVRVALGPADRAEAPDTPFAWSHARRAGHWGCGPCMPSWPEGHTPPSMAPG